MDQYFCTCWTNFGLHNFKKGTLHYTRDLLTSILAALTSLPLLLLSHRCAGGSPGTVKRESSDIMIQMYNFNVSSNRDRLKKKLSSNFFVSYSVGIQNQLALGMVTQNSTRNDIYRQYYDNVRQVVSISGCCRQIQMLQIIFLIRGRKSETSTASKK